MYFYFANVGSDSYGKYFPLLKKVLVDFLTFDIIYQDNCMLGMGSGQPNRLESLRIALKKAGDEVKGAALASDAFFPFGNY